MSASFPFKLAQVNLHQAAEACSWSVDIQILVLGGFLTRFYPELDPEKFADATSVWAQTLPQHLATDILCTMIDLRDKDSGFVTYLEDVVHEYLLAQQPPSPPPEEAASTKTTFRLGQKIQVVLSEEDSAAVMKFMAADMPIDGEELGTILHRVLYVDPERPGVTIFIDVINTEPRPMLDLYLMDKGKLRASHSAVDFETLQEGRDLTLPYNLRLYEIHL